MLAAISMGLVALRMHPMRTVLSTLGVVIGVTFGLYPALRASRLNPVDAIRYE